MPTLHAEQPAASEENLSWRNRLVGFVGLKPLGCQGSRFLRALAESEIVSHDDSFAVKNLSEFASRGLIDATMESRKAGVLIQNSDEII
jgi:hypothetical protein